jgi:hypothetical protein
MQEIGVGLRLLRCRKAKQDEEGQAIQDQLPRPLQYDCQGMKDYLAGETVWRLPEDYPPPLGVKMLLLNGGGVCVMGTWGDWAVAWSPLPKIPDNIKQRLIHGHLLGCDALPHAASTRGLPGANG